MIALAALAAAPAAAQPIGDTVTVRIAFADAEVATPEARAALEARIDDRLRKACSLESAARYTFGRAVVDGKCLADARVAALAEVDRIAAAKAPNARTVAAN
jgi:UrcA family protein